MLTPNLLKVIFAAALMVSMVAVAVKLADTALADHTTGGDLLPELVTVPPTDMSIRINGSEKRLYFQNETVNQHTGVLEIFPQTFPGNDTDDCDYDNDPSNDRVVFQRVYQDKDNDGVFRRGVDTEFRAKETGCMVFHPAHDHFHFEGFNSYVVADLSGNTLVNGGKRSSCLTDSRLRENLPGAPSDKYYLFCEDQIEPQGISVGWSDIYGPSLPDQYVEVTGLPDGEYCLVSTADPDNLLEEVDDSISSNRAATRFRLSGNSVSELSGQSCPTSSSPPAAYYVYDDALHWEDWSWRTTVSPSVSSPVFSGTRSLGVTFNSAWAGLSLHTDGFDTTPYSSLGFAIHPAGRSLSSIDAALYNSADQYIEGIDIGRYASPAANGWYQVSIPLTELKGANTTITRVQLQDGTGAAQPTFYVDDIEFPD